MKTKVKVLGDVHQEHAKKGDIGYIDGYIRGACDRPHAVVVIGKKFSLVPLYMLEAIIKEESNLDEEPLEN